MDPEEFKAYQKILSKKQVEFLEERKKLCPKVILSDDLFDASIGDIPIALSNPPQEMKKPVVHKATQSKSVELF